MSGTPTTAVSCSSEAQCSLRCVHLRSCSLQKVSRWLCTEQSRCCELLGMGMWAASIRKHPFSQRFLGLSREKYGYGKQGGLPSPFGRRKHRAQPPGSSSWSGGPVPEPARRCFTATRYTPVPPLRSAARHSCLEVTSVHTQACNQFWFCNSVS